MEATEAAAAWKRPASVPYPSVWRRYKGKKRMADGKIPTFKIQDIPEDMFQEIINIMTTVFLRDEIVCNSLKILDDPKSLKEFQDMWKKILSYKIGLVAIVDEERVTETSPRIAGINVTGVTLKTDKFSYDMFEGPAMRTLVKFCFDHAITPHVNICEYFKVDAYMSALGLLVLPEYRGQGLSVEILKARFPLCKAVGLEAMMTIFSAPAAQAAGQKAGMKTLHEEAFEDYKLNGNKVFLDLDGYTLKVMACAV